MAEVVKAGLFASSPTIAGTGLAVVAHPPIQPGDTVYLLSGDHGAVLIRGWYGGASLVGFANSSYVIIAALPGQTPIVDSLTINGASNWAFSGITFQGLNPNGVAATPGPGVPDFNLISITGPHQNIAIDSNTIRSTSDVSQWSIGDWITKRSSGVHESGGSCVAITNNLIQNVGYGIQTQLSTGVLIQGNTINYFSNDGIDFGSNSVLIQSNLIENSIEDGDGAHRDAMQGQPYTESSTVQNITVAWNTVMRVSDPNLRYPGYLQGINEFDGTWKNILVKSNIIITDATDGLVLLGPNNSQILSNDVLADNGKVLPCSGLTFTGCQSQSVVYDTSTIPRIVISPTKSGAPANGVTVSGNIATTVSIDSSTLNATISNNLSFPTTGAYVLNFPINGVMLWETKSGTYGLSNVIPTFGPTQLFKEYDTTSLTYNLGLKIANPALAN